MSRAQRVVGAVELIASSATSGIASLGIDAVELVEFERDVIAAGDEFLALCFTPDELAYCGRDIEKLASRFALKEAALKALGTGMRGIGLHDVIVDTAPSGEPRLRLSSAAAAVAAARGVSALQCSATHESGLALAVVAASRSHDGKVRP